MKEDSRFSQLSLKQASKPVCHEAVEVSYDSEEGLIDKLKHNAQQLVKSAGIDSLFYDQFNAFYPNILGENYTRLANMTMQESRWAEFYTKGSIQTLALWQYPGGLAGCQEVVGRFEQRDKKDQRISGPEAIFCCEGTYFKMKLSMNKVISATFVGQLKVEGERLPMSVYELNTGVMNAINQTNGLILSLYNFHNDISMDAAHVLFKREIDPQVDDCYRRLKQGIAQKKDTQCDFSWTQAIIDAAIEACKMPLANKLLYNNNKEWLARKWILAVAFGLITTGAITFEVLAIVFSWTITLGLSEVIPAWAVGIAAIVGSVLMYVGAHRYARAISLAREFKPFEMKLKPAVVGVRSVVISQSNPFSMTDSNSNQIAGFESSV